MGQFEIVVSNHETGEILQVKRWENHFVDDGKYFALDHIFGYRNWFAPGVTTTTWAEMSSRYFKIGDSTNTNDGVVGPTLLSGVDPNGPWQGVNPEDSRLTSPIASKLAMITRGLASKLAVARATFTDAELGTGEVEIHEVGIFLSSGLTDPAGEPALHESYRPQAMICRGVGYLVSGSLWFADPIIRAAGSDITVSHEFGDLNY